MEGDFLTYAIDSHGKMVYIEDVPNGLACNCICPQCHEPLISRNGGEIREHHFAHVSGNECEGAYETAFHLLAKEIISQAKSVMMPKYRPECKAIFIEKCWNCNEHELQADEEYRKFVISYQDRILSWAVPILKLPPQTIIDKEIGIYYTNSKRIAYVPYNNHSTISILREMNLRVKITNEDVMPLIDYSKSYMTFV
jgi:hypothetical protein